MPRYFRISNGQIVNNTEGGREKKKKKRENERKMGSNVYGIPSFSQVNWNDRLFSFRCFATL